MSEPSTAELAVEVAALRRRVEVMRHVSRDVSLHVNDNATMVDLVVDDVLAAWAVTDYSRPLDETWHVYANRVEYDDPAEGALRPDICARQEPADPSLALFDTDEYLHSCWTEHCEILSINAAQPLKRRARAA